LWWCGVVALPFFFFDGTLLLFDEHVREVRSRTAVPGDHLSGGATDAEARPWRESRIWPHFALGIYDGLNGVYFGRDVIFDASDAISFSYLIFSNKERKPKVWLVLIFRRTGTDPWQY
jgi:hypothetical protein